ncbi:MAG: DUF1294 domain-containing protein [Oscillibacter sp.]|nr:DUF1294 domain-containing protein [Oscillibacter sp.]
MESKYFYSPEAQTDTVFAIIGRPWALLLGWLVLINLVTFFVFGFDKLQAKRKEKKESIRRVPEKTLLILSAIGGSVGALIGMRVWRHKTLHKKFRFGVPLILALQIILPFGLWLYWNVIRVS